MCKNRLTQFLFFTPNVLVLFWIIVPQNLLPNFPSMHQGKTEWLKLNLFWHPHTVVINLPENRHRDNSIRNWGEFNYGWPTLQMNLVFRALNQNRADRVEVVIVTASKRACPCFGHLKGEKQSQIIIHAKEEVHFWQAKGEKTLKELRMEDNLNSVSKQQNRILKKKQYHKPSGIFIMGCYIAYT